ncbi:MAG: geranylgeranylglycerol-phosphate geranylgeranyltransferase [Cytophagales bacterium]|nr:geranylgeranylglycerol-phosphate geranylgeranyltransferase [Cytophagales bacterium]MDW8383192.1 geranylgeranylglycerol-phosphate geranylgeranyltransferase [Flammeovirgaceae bacterium]
MFAYLVAFAKLVRLKNLLIIVLTQYISRICLVGPKSHWKTILFEKDIFLITLSTVLMASAGYIINDYYDIKIDNVNKPERVIIGRIISRRQAMLLHQLLNVIGIFLGVLLSWKIAFINFMLAFWLWLYSNALKRKPLVGNLIVALLTSEAIFVLIFHYQEHHLLIYTFAAFSFLISLIREIIKDIEDIRGDMQFGCKTLPIVWGIRKTKALIYILLLILVFLMISLGYVLQIEVMRWYLILMILPLFYFVKKLYWADTKKAYHELSSLCKYIMLSGIVLMLFLPEH